MSLENAINQQLQAIAEAKSVSDVEQAVAELKALELHRQLTEDSLNRFKGAFGNCLLMFLDEQTAAPRYRHWLATYFGQAEVQYADARQQPEYMYFPALEPKPWFETEDFALDDDVLAQSQRAADELAAFIGQDKANFEAYVKGSMADSAWDSLVGSDDWGALPLMITDGQSKLLEQLPETRQLIEKLPLAELSPMAPEVFLSRLKPGVELPPHYGLSNLKTTAHFPVILPDSDKLSITVGGETRQWQSGQWLIFDDSFLHSAENHSDEERVVLICDFWNPLLTEEERPRISQAIRTIECANDLFRSWR